MSRFFEATVYVSTVVCRERRVIVRHPRGAVGIVPMRVGSLFSGIGGLDLGLERAGMRVVWQVENDPYCRQVLARHWPDVPCYGDIRDVDFSEVEPVDLICGGFPCQDISSAHTSGKRMALEGRQSGLWTEFRRAVSELRPAWALVENVAQWQSWLPSVRGDLATLGYASLPIRLSASDFGAPHNRPRIFVVAHADSNGERLVAIHEEVARLRPIARRGGYWRGPSPRARRMDDGTSHGMDRLRVLGNVVVPQVSQWLGERILEHAEATS